MSVTRIKSQYFLTSFIAGAYTPFLPLHLHDLGISDGDIGWILSIAGLSMLFTPLLIGYLADHHFGNKKILIISLLFSCLMLIALMFSSSFFRISIFYLLLSIAYLPLFPALDATTMTELNESNSAQRTNSYTQIRIFCSLGFITPAFILFPILQYLECRAVTGLGLAALGALLAGINAFLLPNTYVKPEKKDLNSLKDSWQKISKSSLKYFLLVVFLLYLGMGAIDTFQSRYFQEIGLSQGWSGVFAVTGSAIEIPFVLCGVFFIKRIGAVGILAMGALASVIRFTLLCFYPSPEIAFATQFLHAPIVLAIVFLPPCFFDSYAENRYRTSLHAWYALSCHGIAKFLASAFGGVVASASYTNTLLGLQTIFFFAGLSSVLALLIVVIYWRKLRS